MDKLKIETAKQIGKDLNQFEKSQLQPIIQQITKCDYDTAFERGKSYCNFISWYGGLYSSGKIQMPFQYFLESLFDNKFADVDGNLLVVKDKIAPVCFGFDFPVNYLSDFNNVKDPSKLNIDSFYQLKIVNSSHYMNAYIDYLKDKLTMFIVDSHNRGYGVPAIGAKRITPDFFSWLIKVS